MWFYGGKCGFHGDCMEISRDLSIFNYSVENATDSRTCQEDLKISGFEPSQFTGGSVESTDF